MAAWYQRSGRRSGSDTLCQELKDIFEVRRISAVNPPRLQVKLAPG